MKIARREFLTLSAMACGWLLTGCRQEEPIQEQAVRWQPQQGRTNTEVLPTPQRQRVEPAALRNDILIPPHFELPLEGATGFVGAAVLSLTQQADETSTELRRLAVGDMFYIRRESGAFWQVCLLDGTVGWVQSAFCMINLPDVLPSVIYENPNAVSSIFVTLGEPIAGITGEKLYDGLFYNQRLEREEFVMPLNYNMAKKVGRAQQSALAAGDCLKIVEAFRPYVVQMQVKDALLAKANADRSLMAELNRKPWSISWFIATSLSNHQRGVAMDVTLVRSEEQTECSMAGCSYVRVKGEEYEMPSAMHELSSAAACFVQPISSNSATAWKTATPAETMTEGALRLQGYCTGAGLTPLASEWWHFNDLDAQNLVRESSGNGKFWLDGCVSWRAFEA